MQRQARMGDFPGILMLGLWAELERSEDVPDN